MSDHKLSRITKWASREEWQEAFEECTDVHVAWACEKANVTLDEIGEVLGDDLASMLFACVFEDFLTWRLEDGRNIVDDYLKRRGWNESVPVKRYLEGLRSSAMSLYEVSEIERDKGFLARDLVRGGEPVRIWEKKGTHYLKPWDRVAMRVVQLGARSESAGGLLPFSPELCADFMKRFKRLKKAWATDVRKTLQEEGVQIPRREFNDGANEGILRRCAFIFTALWLDDTFGRILDRKLPTLCNTDGEPIAYTEVRYPLRDDADTGALRAALDSIPEFCNEGSDNVWRWSTRPTRKSSSAKRAIAGMGDGTVSLGCVELERKSVVLTCNSVQRAERGRALIEKAAGQLLKMPVMESRTAEQLMAEPRDEEAPARACALSPAEERAIIQQSLENHYRSVLDEPIPMLGNVTPRDAAKSKKGRTKLVEWLKLLENNSARHDPGSPVAGYDFGWMWVELGVADLRR